MHSSLGASIYRLQTLGPKNEGKITHFKKPRNFALAVDVLMIVVEGTQPEFPFPNSGDPPGTPTY